MSKSRKGTWGRHIVMREGTPYHVTKGYRTVMPQVGEPTTLNAVRIAPRTLPKVYTPNGKAEIARRLRQMEARS